MSKEALALRQRVLRGDAAEIHESGGEVQSIFNTKVTYKITSKWQLLSQDVWEVCLLLHTEHQLLSIISLVFGFFTRLFVAPILNCS